MPHIPALTIATEPAAPPAGTHVRAYAGRRSPLPRAFGSGPHTVAAHLTVTALGSQRLWPGPCHRSPALAGPLAPATTDRSPRLWSVTRQGCLARTACRTCHRRSGTTLAPPRTYLRHGGFIILDRSIRVLSVASTYLGMEDPVCSVGDIAGALSRFLEQLLEASALLSAGLLIVHQ